MIDPSIAYIKPKFKIIKQPGEVGPSETFTGTKRKNRKNYTEKREICVSVLKGQVCSKGEQCTHSHDLEAYLRAQPPKIDRACLNMLNYNNCPFDLTCRFLHPTVDRPSTTMNYYKEISNVIDTEFLKKLRKYYHKKDDSFLGDKGLTAVTEEPKKLIDFRGKLYLAPLTTVGNLPFRRICKEYGADVTCSEMVFATSLLQGKKGDWALLKRHDCEDVFGVQIAGTTSNTLIKAVKLICENAKVDFIDLNMGCPIDLLYKKGAGCALMGNAKKAINIISNMVKASTVPITVKMRTGIKTGENIAHKLIPLFEQAGAAAVTIHGRSREQRYTKLADWDYIDECASSSSVPIIGNGDVLSFQDVIERPTGKLATTMVGRGALVKPWIFTEIKEQRVWDISSKERLEMIERYVNHGLVHWGSDTQGVEKTRIFLLEWLSFLCRYVPVGILERAPQKMNQRPEAFVGRDDLETLFASQDVRDWIKITSLFLDSPKDDFEFFSKHKSTSYG